MKKYIALVIAMIVPFALVANANAANETVTATTTLAPQGGGNYFKEVTSSSQLTIRAEVNTPSDSPKVNPMKNVKITVPERHDLQAEQLEDAGLHRQQAEHHLEPGRSRGRRRFLPQVGGWF
ncbi:MAG TPA: hypothetical protein PLE93_11345, partial [Solirubrobacterales bacterium]|nr:hypothetical protein [Solirubrobacterales bacterium]